MTYAIRWTALDDSGESGYLRSFDSRAEAIDYALEYARSVGTAEVTVAPRVFGSDVVASFIADKGERGGGYRERVYVTDLGEPRCAHAYLSIGDICAICGREI